MTVAYSSTLSQGISSLVFATLTVGTDYMGYESNQANGSFSSIVGSLTGSSTPSIQRTVETNKGYYTQGQVAFGNSLFLTVGVRREDNTNYGKNYTGEWTPRFGASTVREFGDVTAKLRAAFGRATRTPVAGRSDAAVGTNPAFPVGYLARLGNPNLQPERQSGPEGGLELYFGNRADVQITYYKQKVEDLVTLRFKVDSIQSLLPDVAVDCGTPKEDGYCYSEITQYRNIGTVRNRGWESQANVNLTSTLRLSGTYSNTLSRVQNLNAGENSRLCAGQSGTGNCYMPGQVFFYFPEHTGSLRLAYNDAKTMANLSISYVGPKITDQPDEYRVANNTRLPVSWSISPVGKRHAGQQIPGYESMDLQATRTIARRLRAFVRITNLMNTYDNVEFGESRMAIMGRQSSLGAVVQIF